MKRLLLLWLPLSACSSSTRPPSVQVSTVVSGPTVPETVQVNQLFSVTFVTSTWGADCGVEGGRTEVSVSGGRADITPLDTVIPGPSDCMGDVDNRTVSFLFSGFAHLPSVAFVVVHSADYNRTANVVVTP